MHKCPHKPKPRDPEQRSANFRLFSCLPRAWPPPKCKHLLLDTSSHPCCLGRHCLGIRFLERRCLVLGCHTYYQTLTTLCDTYYLVWPTTLPCVKLSHLLSDTYYLVRHLLPCATPITLPCVRLSHLLSDTYYQCDNLLPYTDPPPHEQSPVSVCSKSALDLGPRSCNRCKHKYMMAGGNMICCNSGDLGACPRTWSWGGVWSAKNKRGLEFEESDGRKGRS